MFEKREILMCSFKFLAFRLYPLSTAKKVVVAVLPKVRIKAIKVVVVKVAVK